MIKINNREVSTKELIYPEGKYNNPKQSIVIQYMPRPQPVEFYRGELKPLSMEELELF